MRQLLAESLVLSGLGLLVGVVLARGAIVFLEQLVPPGMLLFARPTLDLRTLGFTALVSLTAGVLFGLAPAMHATTLGFGSALRASGRGVSGSSARRGVLVVAQVAMTLVLLVVAGLLMQSLYRLRYADVGFRPDGVITLRTTLPSDRYGTHARRAAFYDDVLERVARLPGVLGAGYTTSVPLAWKGATTGFVIEGRPAEPDAEVRRQSSAGQHGLSEGDRRSADRRPLLQRERSGDRSTRRHHQPDDGPAVLAGWAGDRQADKGHRRPTQRRPVAHGRRCRA